MIEIIGEKINGTRSQVAQAIEARDASFIQHLACTQAKAGASWIDLNAGTLPAKEPEALLWLVNTVQAVIETPLCLDSAHPLALSLAIKAVQKTPMINSISGEPERLEKILPLAAGHGCRVIALAMDEKGIPGTSRERLEVVHKVIETTRSAGIPDEHVYIDPLVMTLSTNVQSGVIFLDTLKSIHAVYPEVHLTAGLSNISFGLPARSLINRVFLILAMGAGLNSAILDPLDRELRAALLSAELVLGQDPHCFQYIQAFRAGIIQTTDKKKS